jgi:hypothetical protein
MPYYLLSILNYTAYEYIYIARINLYRVHFMTAYIINLEIHICLPWQKENHYAFLLEKLLKAHSSSAPYNKGKNLPSIFSPLGTGGTPSKSSSFVS